MPHIVWGGVYKDCLQNEFWALGKEIQKFSHEENVRHKLGKRTS